MTSALIIPIRDERKNISYIVKQSEKYVDEIIVVDDKSTDDSAALASAQGATVLQHENFLGKGAAIKTGCEYALNKHKNIVLMDADKQHQPKDIPRFLEKLKTYEVVFSYREGNAEPLHKTANSFFSWIYKNFFGIYNQDTQSGFRAFQSSCYPTLRWKATDSLVESEMLYRARHLKQISIPIKQFPQEVKAHKIWHSIRILLHLIQWKLR